MTVERHLKPLIVFLNFLIAAAKKKFLLKHQPFFRFQLTIEQQLPSLSKLAVLLVYHLFPRHVPNLISNKIVMLNPMQI